MRHAKTTQQQSARFCFSFPKHTHTTYLMKQIRPEIARDTHPPNSRCCLTNLPAHTPNTTQLQLTSDVENFPGYADAVSGPDLMEDLRKQAEVSQNT